MDLILGGWNVNFLANAHSGFPVTVFASAANSRRQNASWQSCVRMLTGHTRSRRRRWMLSSVPSPLLTSALLASIMAPAPSAVRLTGSWVARGRYSAWPSFFNLDASIGKKFFVTERQYLDFRMEMFNAFNHASWGAPGRNITDPGSFGQITSQVQNPRNIQFGLKYYF